MILCLTHGAVKGYIVCVHVMAGGTITHFQEASDKPGPRGLGEALCAACVEVCDLSGQPPLDHLRMVCAVCLKKIEARSN